MRNCQKLFGSPDKMSASAHMPVSDRKALKRSVRPFRSHADSSSPRLVPLSALTVLPSTVRPTKLLATSLLGYRLLRVP